MIINDIKWPFKKIEKKRGPAALQVQRFEMIIAVLN